MSRFIVTLPWIDVTDANATTAGWSLTPPGPTSFVGFAQAMALKCLPSNLSHEFIGVGVVMHDYRLRAEKIDGTYSWFPHQLRAAALIDKEDYVASTQSLSLQPTARCDLTVSLAVVFHEDASVDIEKINLFMRNARVAGGTVAMDLPPPVLLGNMDEVKKYIKTGFALHERPDLMAPADGEDALDALLRATLPTQKNLKENPFVMPATMGFAAVTDVAERLWSRDNHMHAFAEPLVGLVQWKSLNDASTSIPIWKYRTPADRVYLVGH